MSFMRYISQSNDDEPIPESVFNELARALARWENEGGATDSAQWEGSGEVAVYSPAEQQALQCLGTAVIAQWAGLLAIINQ